MATISLSEIDKEHIASFFRGEFNKFSLDPRACEIIIQGILRFSETPDETVLISIDDVQCSISADQVCAVKKLIKMFITNLEGEIINIRRRNRMN